MPRKKMKKRPVKMQRTDVGSAVRELLERYSCPYKFHRVRAGFMGNISSPDLDVFPLQEVERSWNGEMPVFANELEVNLFMQTMVNEFYNKLCDHQDPKKLFKFVKLNPGKIDREYLARFGRIRREELEGYIGGLFSGQDEMEMPVAAHEIIPNLLKIRDMFATAEKAANDPSELEDGPSIERMHKQLQEMTCAAEGQINILIQLGKAARVGLAKLLTMKRPKNIN